MVTRILRENNTCSWEGTRPKASIRGKFRNILSAFRPDSAFNPANLVFNLKSINGTSADGCAEYTLPGPLKGRLLICFFEGTHTIHTFAFNPTGTAVTDNRPLLGDNNESLRFTNPST